MALPGTKGRRRVYLMRHGHVSYVDPEGMPVDPKTVLLTEAGQAQALAAQKLLREIEFDRAMCSGMPRTRQTAKIVLGERDISLEDNDGFVELSGGRLSQVAPEEREAAFVYGLERADSEGERFAGGELFASFEKRITATFDELILQPDWKRLLLVCHDAVNRMILSHVCGAGLAGIASFEQDMACINVIDIDVIDGRVERCLIKAVNITPYNTTKDGMYHTSLEEVFKTLFDF